MTPSPPGLGVSQISCWAPGAGRARLNGSEPRRGRIFQGTIWSVPSGYNRPKETALFAGKLDAEQQRRGVVIPFADLLIGATALVLGYSVLTVNDRHFGRIPGLSVIKL